MYRDFKDEVKFRGSWLIVSSHLGIIELPDSQQLA
jgi:hypothetical protein